MHTPAAVPKPPEPTGATAADHQPPAGGALEHYYEGTYWNTFAEGIRQLNLRASGDAERSFLDDFQSRMAGRRFERALILNCGNGWFERELFERDMVAAVVGVDWSEELLAEATRQAEAAGYPAEYVHADINEFEPSGPIDLIVNHAAGHHIRDLDRVLRRCRAILPHDGILMAWDYVGPHRNQYPWEIWDAAWQANAALPPEARGPMRYPHLPTMLAVDPSEAIHSELYERIVDRYFELDVHKPIGGAIAYLVLADNQAMFGLPQPLQDDLVAELFDCDAEFLAAHPEHNLFAYSIARPRLGALDDEARLAQWAEEEQQREREATSNGGEYYPHGTLQEMTMAWADDQVDAEHRLASIHELQAAYDALAARFPNPQRVRFETTSAGQWVKRRMRRS